MSFGEWEVITEHLFKGKEYSISVGGRSSDGCNSAEAGADGILDGNIIGLDNLEWAITMRGCQP